MQESSVLERKLLVSAMGLCDKELRVGLLQVPRRVGCSL